MRLSVDPADPGFHPAGKERGVIVLLDGDPMRHVITADEERGYVICHVHDDAGRPVIQGDSFQTKIVFGRVRLIVPPFMRAGASP